MSEREPKPPADPSGIEEPHDVLAADEFAMPAATVPYENGGPSRVWLPVVALLGAIAAAAIVARRRRTR
jgi:MYXO-CTERM domain-containing protein